MHYQKLVLIFISFLALTSTVNAQTAISLEKVSNYQATGSTTITTEGTRYRATTIVNNLPTEIPNSGTYYVLWATIQDGRADNLGTVTNGQSNSALVAGTPKQIFITAEKERFPEFVQGPRIAQSKEITGLPALPTATPRPSGSVVPVGGSGTIGQPNDAPETGLGGSYVFYTFTAALIVFGTFGMLLSLRQASQTKK